MHATWFTLFSPGSGAFSCVRSTYLFGGRSFTLKYPASKGYFIFNMVGYFTIRTTNFLVYTRYRVDLLLGDLPSDRIMFVIAWMVFGLIVNGDQGETWYQNLNPRLGKSLKEKKSIKYTQPPLYVYFLLTCEERNERWILHITFWYIKPQFNMLMSLSIDAMLNRIRIHL